MKRMVLVCAIGLGCLPAARAVDDYPVEPGVKYRLSFTAALEGNAVAPFPGWEVRMLDGQGRVPYEGRLNAGWQVCSNTQPTAYRHTFYTPTNAARLQVLFEPEGSNRLRVEGVKLEKAEDGNLLPGPPVFTDLRDYSGWSELSKAFLVEGTNGIVLRILPGGYALSDPAPIRPGTWQFGKSSLRYRIVFLYDDLMNLKEQAWPGARWTPPPDCSYFRVFLGPGDVEAVTLAPVPEKRK